MGQDKVNMKDKTTMTRKTRQHWQFKGQDNIEIRWKTTLTRREDEIDMRDKTALTGMDNIYMRDKTNTRQY